MLPDVLQPRDHQAALSLYRDGGHSTILLGGGLVCPNEQLPHHMWIDEKGDHVLRSVREIEKANVGKTVTPKFDADTHEGKSS
ncbi:hypothetical protein L484_027511 [Morus notabilis]|uniref:Uncharacterized protein n=1 Tax=Morus notabilis TaxID=981085 RepID=W9RY47_9ROSA|nr:hypothetical protein L484_027511 [Morus notabilis]